MKEYLTKNSNGDYQIVNHRFSDDDIEIPEGAEVFMDGFNTNRGYAFYKDNFDMVHGDNRYWEECSKWDISKNAVVRWQREPKYKEFLNANDNYNLVMLPEHAGDDEKSGLIEVPDGADKYVYFNEYDNANFYKGDFDAVWQDDEYWDHDMDDYKSYCKKFSVVLWQRYIQPESLPFVDDEVNHPSHYTTHPSGIECITITRHHDFAIGNAIKYLWRAGLKDSDNEIQDLEKAIWYINDKIEQLKNAK